MNSYVIQYQRNEDESPAVFSVFDSNQDWQPAVGAEYDFDVSQSQVKAKTKQAVKEGFRPTGDLTRSLLK